MNLGIFSFGSLLVMHGEEQEALLECHSIC